MAKNILSLQLLRNTTVFNNKNAAIAGITGTPTSDGVIKLARYTEDNKTKTIFGIYNDTSVGTAGYTIYDSYQEVIAAMQDQIADLSSGTTDAIDEINDKLGDGVGTGTGESVTDQLEALSGDSSTAQSGDTSVEGAKKYADEKIAQAVDGLDYTDSAVAGQYVSQVTEADGVISVTRVALPSVNAISETGKPITAVSESLGAISATAGTINSKFVDVSGFTATDVQGALEEISGAVGTAISGLDYTDTAVTGSYVSKVDEADGVISVTRVALPTVAAISETGKPITAVSESLGEISATAGTINAEYVNVADSGNLFTGTTVEAVLAEIDAAYKAADTALKNEILGDASESGNTLGELEDRIEELEVGAKEYHIVKTTTGLPATVKESYSLQDADNHVSGDTIDIPKDSHIVSITYITTGEHAQNLEYVYIDASGNTQTTYVDMSSLVLEAEFASGVTATDHIVHGVVDPTSEEDSSNTAFLTVGANGFKIDGIKDEIAAQIGALDNTSDSAVTGQYITHITESNGIVSAGGRANVSEAVLNNYSQGSASGAVASTDTINQAFGKVENQIAAINSVVEDLDASVTGGTTAGTATSDHIQVIVDEVNGKLTAVTVTETNIADADDLATLSAKTVTEIGSSNSSISATTAATTAADGTVKYDVTTDASKIKMTGFTADASGFTAITTASTVTEAIKAIETTFLANEQVTAQALNDLESTKVETIVVNGVTGTTTTGANPSASVTIDGGDVVLGADYVKPATGTPITTADTVDQALGKLEAKVDAAVSGGVTAITASSGITVDSTAINNPVIGAKLSSTGLPSGIAENAIKFDSTENGMYIEYIDAGTY